LIEAASIEAAAASLAHTSVWTPSSAINPFASLVSTSIKCEIGAPW
jgi:hypothetical protein